MTGFRRAHFAIFGLLFAAFVSASAPAWTERVEDLPQPTDYVSDYAHVLSPQAIARLDRLCTQLDHSATNTKMAVVTVRTLDGVDSAEYANALEDKWKMGKKGVERNVLVLLAVNDHKRRIDVGYGLEGILNDAKVGDIGREMVPALRANDFDGAVTLAVGEVAQVIAADAKVTLDDQPTMAPRQPVRHQAHIGKLILLLIVLLFFGGFHLLRFLMGFGLFGGFRGGPWIGGGGFGGGGGDSGGGGFGGFGGDGGGFGGGGAGGDW
jgi:uncharacterized protein